MTDFDHAVIGKPRLSAVWLLPVVAAAIALWLLYKNISETGLVIDVTFSSGSGISAGKTQVIYQGITVGKVGALKLNDDFKGVTASLEMDREIAPLIRKNTQFWLVSPQVSLSRISGLDTLVSGNYITFKPGDGDDANRFAALDEPPPFAEDSPGLHLNLQAETLGSVSLGAPVLFQQIAVGSVQNYHLNDDGVEIQVVIEPRYQHLVKSDSRFWNASGIKVEASLTGVAVETGSISSIMAGGIAFDSPPGAAPAEADQHFTLLPERPDSRDGMTTRIVFVESDGLREGSALRYKGMQIGRVTSLQLSGDSADNHVVASVRIAETYRGYVNADSEFWLVKPEINGMTVRGLDTLISGPYIALRSDEQPSPARAQYTALSQAPDTRINAPGLRLTLRTEELRSVNIGSKIYYRKIAVGQVESVSLDSKGVNLGIFIHDAYRHLVHRDSRFYNASGIQISGGFNGLEVQADSVASILSGGIAFYSPESKSPQAAWEGLQYPLFNDYKSSQADTGLEILLHFDNAVNLSKGTELKYQGIKVGEVLSVELDSSMKGVDVTARLAPTARALAREGSRFWLVRPELGLASSRNLETLVTGSYIGIEPGGGKRQLKFVGLERSPTVSAPQNGLNLVLLSPRRGSIKEGVKVFYRDVPVGHVYGYELSDDARQTHILINIESRYVGLVNAGSRFWNSSGIDIDFSVFRGANIRSKSIESLLEGGIAFATPDAKSPRVNNDSQFTLHDSVESHWLQWDPALPVGE